MKYSLGDVLGAKLAEIKEKIKAENSKATVVTETYRRRFKVKYREGKILVNGKLVGTIGVKKPKITPFHSAPRYEHVF